MPFRRAEDQMASTFRRDGDERRAPPDPTFDFFRSMVPGVQKGVVGMSQFFNDMPQMQTDLAAYAAEKLTGRPVDAATKEHLGIASRLTNPVSALQYVAGKVTGAPSGSRGVNAAREQQFGAYYRPQTEAGRVGEAVGAALPGMAVGPGSMAARAVQTVVPAASGELARYGVEKMGGDPTAQALAQLGAGVGTGAVAGALMQPRAPQGMFAESLRGVTQAQYDDALALIQRAQAQGVQLTLPEAIQQLTNSATGAGRLQRLVEGTREGAQVIGPVMSQRPAQVAGAVGNFADTVAPPTAYPSMLGVQTQETADRALADVRQAINAQARPHYDALPGNVIPPADIASLSPTARATYEQALAGIRANPVLNAEIAHLPDTDAAVMNEVMKRLNTLSQNATPNPANMSSDATLAAAYQRGGGELEALAAANAPTWGPARETVAAGRGLFLEPLQAGPLGKWATTPDPAKQRAAMFPTNPEPGSQVELVDAIGQLNRRSPGLAAQMARQHVLSTFNEADQNLQGGWNQWGGAKWAAAVAGNPQQRQTLLTGVDEAGGDAQALAALLDTMEATGKRQAQGSLTSFNSEDLKRLGDAGFMGELARTGANLPGALRRWGEAIQRWQMGRNAEGLAALLLEPPNALPSLPADTYSSALARSLTATLGSREPAELERKEEERRKRARVH